ncbi:MAG: DNA-3-methyladenine glycosylase 2 family protein [Pseudomonadota bacterium]
MAGPQNILTLDASVIRAAEKHLKQVDPELGAVIKAAEPCAMHERRQSLFDALASSIVGQQLSTRAAASIFTRLRGLAGTRQLTAAAIAATTTPALRAVGLSQAKTKAIQTLSAAVLDGRLSLRSIARRPDDEVIAALTQLPGIGLWTAQMFLMFALKRADVLSPGDLGLRRGLQILDNLPEEPEPQSFLNRAEIWRPYRSVASWYLWRVAEQGRS